MEKQMNVPELRFPEFEEDKSNVYKKHFFKDIFLFSTGKNIKQNESSPQFETPCVRYGELYHMYNEVINEVINKTNLDKSELLFSDGDEILLPSAGEDPLDIGSASALTIKNVAIGRTINILKPVEENIYSQIYVSYYINHKLKKHISTLAKGVSISNVYNSDLKTLEIMLPNLEEQQKNAAFFTAIDEKLKTLKKKKSLLENYKKGVMQKIFSQELRFKPVPNEASGDENGKAFADWEVKKLGEVMDFKVTNSFSRENLNYEIGTIKNIHYGDIHTKFQTLFDITKEIVPFINEEMNVNRVAEDFYCKEGDIIFADASEDLNDVGKSIEIINLNSEKLLSGLHTLLGRPKEKYFQLGFIGHLFTTQNIRLQIQKEAQGSKVLSINVGRISTINLNIPSLPEQTLIANFLSSLDEKIKNTQTQITQAEIWKKGLLQKMFV